MVLMLDCCISSSVFWKRKFLFLLSLLLYMLLSIQIDPYWQSAIENRGQLFAPTLYHFVDHNNCKIKIIVVLGYVIIKSLDEHIIINVFLDYEKIVANNISFDLFDRLSTIVPIYFSRCFNTLVNNRLTKLCDAQHPFLISSTICGWFSSSISLVLLIVKV